MTSQSKQVAAIMELVCPACIIRRLGVQELYLVAEGRLWRRYECSYCRNQCELRRDEDE